MNGTKLYVGGLPYSTTERSLEDLFAEYGTVESAAVITDRMTGRSRGFGFVEMSNQSEAEAALALNGRDLEGRVLTVNEAKPKNSGGDRAGGSRW
jgi:RNA recognition motif-containing protein